MPALRSMPPVSFGFDSPLALLLVPLLVFVSAAAPWRLLHSRTT